MTTLKNVLEGRPMRSPLHPALVHLPIALFPVSLLLDLASWIWSNPELHLVQASFITLAAGIATAAVAAVFGFVDYSEIRRDHTARKTANQHLTFNLVAVGLFALSLGLRWSAWDAPRAPGLPMVLSLLGVILLSYSGYLGGHMVYSDGVAVGRHRRKRPLPSVTVLVKDEPGRLVMVGNESQLREGDTLRVDANGTIIAVAKAQGQIYAFQEFCTHRYGALSEGEMRGCEVTCPWHRSRFDIRTGEVTAGPAKIPLRIFHVEVRDGKILLRIPEPIGTQRKAEDHGEAIG
jgi:nitrite reductase/ring-hydroxylating ferredoxin subunit/uncharacterized membrane protein